MSKNEIAVVHNGEQGRVQQIWKENECIFAQFIGRLSKQARRVKFLELIFLNKKAEKKAQEALQHLPTKPPQANAEKQKQTSKKLGKTLPLKQTIETKQTLSATA